jgi:hypothetical protein
MEVFVDCEGECLLNTVWIKNLKKLKKCLKTHKISERKFFPCNELILVEYLFDNDDFVVVPWQLIENML